MFRTDYQEFIYKRTYARYLDEEGRREDWQETVARYHNFIQDRVPAHLLKDWYNACMSIEELEVMPSMRALWTAGPAAARDNLSMYNCAYKEMSSIRAFAEVLHVLMNGTGVGFSVERQFVNQLPVVPVLEPDPTRKVVVQDSKEGWARAYLSLLNSLYAGLLPEYDVSKVRPAGARLKIFGGRASGPEPLLDLFQFTVRVFQGAAGRKLSSLEVHDITCKIANIVVSGGVRRSACISLSNLSDDRMANAKHGMFWEQNPQRQLANNSVCYTEKPDPERFIEEWLALIRSKSGERGIFNRESAKFIVQQTGRRDPKHDFGCNPCSEILLRSAEVCNLSEVVIRPHDTLDDLKRKVRDATILGIMQSTYTDFKFVGREWKRNCEEERLLGVSLTGLRDHPVLGRTSTEARLMLAAMKQHAVDVAKEWSQALGINMPAAITCVKPSGSVSQLVDSASGLHHRYSSYYIRRVRVDAVDPVAQMLIEAGVPYNPEVGQQLSTAHTLVFDFPMKAPETAVLRDEETALQQLEYWLMLQTAWCEHKPSITVFVKDSEWMEVGAWVYKNWNYVSGISFLPFDGGVYPLAPYQEITEDEYKELQQNMPALDFGQLYKYEQTDCTVGGKELACHGGACEL
jgi:ribonucleoside-diphosphate reductase alpha chain